MNVIALLLADSRFPGGGHVHSGGLEEAAARGLIRTEADLPLFLRNRLRTAGTLAAVFAAASAHQATRGNTNWQLLDEELDARTPSTAQRAASRAQGKATARAAKSMTPPPTPPQPPTPRESRPQHPRVSRSAPTSYVFETADGAPLAVTQVAGSIPASRVVAEPDVAARVSRSAPASYVFESADGAPLADPDAARVSRSAPASYVFENTHPVSALLATTPRPHHPVILGALVGALGGTPADAALAAAYLSISGPASASVRLLGLDPLQVNAIVAALAADVTAIAEAAVATAHLDPADLPAPGSPGLDLLAEEHDRHHREEVRLFVS